MRWHHLGDFLLLLQTRGILWTEIAASNRKKRSEVFKHFFHGHLGLHHRLGIPNIINWWIPDFPVSKKKTNNPIRFKIEVVWFGMSMGESKATFQLDFPSYKPLNLTSKRTGSLVVICRYSSLPWLHEKMGETWVASGEIVELGQAQVFSNRNPLHNTT